MGRTARCRVLRISLPVSLAGRNRPLASAMAATGDDHDQKRPVVTPAAGNGSHDGAPRVVHRPDTLAVEEPLEIRIDGEPLTVTMRTPGDDIDLAAGFLFTEGVVRAAEDVAEIRKCDDNVADVRLRPGVVISAERLRRNFLTTAACGICGKESIEAVRTRTGFDVAGDHGSIRAAALASFPDRLREAQRLFARTGGLHAAGLFSADGTLAVLREDVGRHNAVDKVAGWALRQGQLPLRGSVLLVSGRASFELVQKALMAGVPMLAAVSAPSSLAVQLAQEAGMTLVGFLRGGSMNAYAGAQRLDVAAAGATGLRAAADGR